MRITEAMTEHVRTVPPTMSAADAGRTIGCLPVIDNGKLIGIITLSDLLQFLGKGVDRPNHNARATLSHRVPHKKQHMATGRW